MEANACPSNITPTGRRQRAGLAVFMLALGLGAGAWLLAGDYARAWRLGLFVPFWIAGLGWFQARGGT